MKEPKPKQLPSGRWFVRVRVNGRDICITDDNEAEVKAKAMAVKYGLMDTARHPDHKTLGEAIDDYVRSREGILSPSTLKAYASYRRNRFQTLMDRKISTLSSAVCQKAVSLEARATTAKTVRNAWGLCYAAIQEAAPDMTIRVTLPKKNAPNGRAITPEELRTVFQAIHGTPYELPILLDAFLGLRRSELFALRKSDFDFDAKTVTITRTLVQDQENQWVERQATKTAAGRRTLPVDDALLEMIKAAPDEGRLIKMHPNTPYAYLYKLTRKMGLPHIRLHDLRHTFASVSHLLGVPDKYVMASGGWASKPVLDNVYTHTLEDGRKMYAERVADYYRDLLPAEKRID